MIDLDRTPDDVLASLVVFVEHGIDLVCGLVATTTFERKPFDLAAIAIEAREIVREEVGGAPAGHAFGAHNSQRHHRARASAPSRRWWQGRYVARRSARQERPEPGRSGGQNPLALNRSTRSRTVCSPTFADLGGTARFTIIDRRQRQQSTRLAGIIAAPRHFFLSDIDSGKVWPLAEEQQPHVWEYQGGGCAPVEIRLRGAAPDGASNCGRMVGQIFDSDIAPRILRQLV